MVLPEQSETRPFGERALFIKSPLISPLEKRDYNLGNVHYTFLLNIIVASYIFIKLVNMF